MRCIHGHRVLITCMSICRCSHMLSTQVCRYAGTYVRMYGGIDGGTTKMLIRADPWNCVAIGHGRLRCFDCTRMKCKMDGS